MLNLPTNSSTEHATQPGAIELDRVCVTRGGRQVVTDVTATVPTGTVVGLLGPSGCGKSTLLRSIVGIQSNVEGGVTVLGLPAGDPQLRTQVGYRSQDLSLVWLCKPFYFPNQAASFKCFAALEAEGFRED